MSINDKNVIEIINENEINIQIKKQGIGSKLLEEINAVAV